jgi:hypothetical protein
MMKKITYLGIVLILLAALAVPAMAKSPGNGNSANTGHGNGAGSGQEVSAGQGRGNHGNHGNQNNQGNRGNNGARGNGNQGQNHPNTPFYLKGTITAVFSDTQTISVTLTQGNAMVKPFIGKDLSIKTTTDTQIFKITQGEDDQSGEGDANRVTIPFDQLAVGQRVAIHGNLMDGVYTARLITVYITAPEVESSGEQQ